MLLVGIAGARLGTLERFEIDATGQMTYVVARGTDAGLRRIASSQVREIGLGSVVVNLTAAEFAGLPEVVAPQHPLANVDRPRLSA
jgi:hypothetical protein